MTGDVLLPDLPTDELVTIAWIGSIPGLSIDIVATTLPPDADKSNQAVGWVVTPPFGFVTVTVVGGSSDAELPVHRPVMQVDCWATRAGSNKPPWNRANKIATAIQYAAWQRTGVNRLLALTAKGVDYGRASVQSARVVAKPRRIRDDPGSYARYQLDVQFQWIALGDVIP